MKTGRRRFLGKMLAGAAAVVGAGAVAPMAVEASESLLWHGPIETRGEVTRTFVPDPGENERFAAVLLDGNTISGNSSAGFKPWPDPFTGRLGPGVYMAPPADYQWKTGATISGAGVNETTIVQPPTFEAMQADCAARGCRLENWITGDGYTMPTHIGQHIEGWGHGHTSALTPTGLAAVDAWRRSLHETS